MNTALLSYLHTLGLHAPCGDRRLTQDDIARAFGGRPSALSQAVHGAETRGDAPMLSALSMAARALLGELGATERAAFPYVWNRARAGLRWIEERLPAGDERAVKMRGLR